MSARNRTLGLEIEAEAARAEILACGVMSGTESLQHWDSARTAKRLRRGSNANSLRGQNSAGFLEICAAFQRDNLRRHFRVRVLPPQPRSRVSVSQVRREFDLRHTLFLQLLYPVIVIIRDCRGERHRSGHSDLS
jgi:hypothetical protein